MTGIEVLEIQRKLELAKKEIESNNSVPEDKREALYQKTSDILFGVGIGSEWVLDSGRYRAILKPGNKEYRSDLFDSRQHLSDWRFTNELALAAYLILDK